MVKCKNDVVYDHYIAYDNTQNIFDEKNAFSLQTWTFIYILFYKSAFRRLKIFLTFISSKKERIKSTPKFAILACKPPFRRPIFIKFCIQGRIPDIFLGFEFHRDLLKMWDMWSKFRPSHIYKAHLGWFLLFLVCGHLGW